MQVLPNALDHRLNTTVIAFLLLFAALSRPVDCSGACPEHLGAWWAGPPKDVAQAGDLVISTIGKRLAIFDISGGDPVEIGDLVFETPLSQVVVANGLACVRTGVSEIKVIDITDPVQPTETGAFDLQTTFREMFLFGTSLFLLGSDNLDLVDISNPANPVLIDSMLTDARTITVNGDYLYLAENYGTFEMAIIDLKDGLRNNPHRVNILQFGTLDFTLASSGSLIFGIDTGGSPRELNSLVILDVSDALDPQLLSRFPFHPYHTYFLDLAVDENRIVTGFASRNSWTGVVETTVQIFDIDDPSQPTISQEIALPLGNSGYQKFSAGHGRFIAQDVSSGIQVYHYENGEYLPRGDTVIPGGVNSLAVGNDIILANAGPLFVIDPTSLQTIDSLGDGLGISEISIEGEIAYLSSRQSLDLYNISQPTTPLPLGSLALDVNYVSDMTVSGNTAFLLKCNGSPWGEYLTPIVYTADVRDPRQPELISEYALPRDAFDRMSSLSISNDLLFLSRENALFVVDMINPVDPFLLNEIDMSDHKLSSIEARGNYLYACAESGFLVFDTTDLTMFELVGETPQPCSQLTLHGNRAFVTPPLWQTDTSFSVFDISNPKNATLLATVQTKGQPTSVALDSGHAYVIEKHTGIGMYDVACLLDRDHTHWVDIVAHGDGLNNSHWRSDIVVFNPHTEAANIEFLVHTDRGTFGLSTVVDANHGGVFEDIVGLIAGEGKGALEVRSPYPVSISGRTYTATAGESHGQYAHAYAPGQGLRPGMIGRLLQLRQEEGRFRSNIVLTNIGPEDAIVEIVLLKPDGAELLTYYLEIRTKKMIQDIEPLKTRAGKPLIGWASARLQLATGSEILASASLIDASTNDATTIPLLFDNR